MDTQLQQIIEPQTKQNQLLKRYAWRSRFGLLTLLVLATGMVSWAEETASSPNAWTELSAKIEKREESVKSFEVRLEERRTDKSLSWVVLMKGDRQIRVEHTGELMSPIGGKPYLAKTIDLSNGNVHKSFCPNLGNRYPGGYITKEDQTHFYDHVVLQPIAFRYKMLKWIGEDDTLLSNDRVSVRKGNVDGKACVIAWWSREMPGRTLANGDAVAPYVNVREVYLDPTREVIPLRVTMVQGSERSRLQWDLDYSAGDAGFALSGWKFVFTNREGDIRHAMTAKVTQWNVNPKLDDSKFDIQFPVGTYVEDKVTGDNYILKEFLRRRPVTKKDWSSGATYETLLNSEPSPKPGIK